MTLTDVEDESFGRLGALAYVIVPKDDDWFYEPKAFPPPPEGQPIVDDDMSMF